MKKVVVITGCSSGIGLETSLYLQKMGYLVCPTARKTEDVAKLQKLGFEDAMQLDVREHDMISKVISEVKMRYKKIDIWFNNAGYGQPGALEDVPTNALKEQFETNVFGLHECTKQIVPVMLEQGFGRIIQHGSVLGIVALSGRGAYNASKYAIEGLCDTLRLELKETPIEMITLNTGPITSDFRKNAIIKLKENIDINHSRFKEKYESSLAGTAKGVPFNEEAIAVAKIVHKIIEAKNPKPRYYITKATYLLGALKRVLSTGLLDKILLKI